MLRRIALILMALALALVSSLPPSSLAASQWLVPTGLGSTSAIRVPESASSKPGYLVLISIDACRPEYLDLAPLPHLMELMERGTMYSDAWVGALVSNTPPGHTEMSTGTFPNHNGILSFNWKDSATGVRSNPTSLVAINNGEMARIVEQNQVPTLAALIKGLYPDAIIAAVSAGKYYAAQGLGMGPTDYILYSKPEPKPKTKPPATPTPGRVLIPVALRGHEPPADVMADPRLRVTTLKPGDDNLFAIQAALVLFDKYRPRGLLINLPATDEVGHKTGGLTAPEEMRQVMLTTDAGIGLLMNAYEQAGIFDQTLWVVTADHGMTPNSKQIEPKALSAVSKKAGLKSALRIPYAYLSKPAEAPALAKALAMSKTPGVIGAFAKIKVGDRYEYRAAPLTQSLLDPSLDQAYQYLLSTFVGSTSPDVVVATEENTLVGTGTLNSRGSHGEVNWADQHIPLIVSGPGVRQGVASAFPARLVDLAPTIARLMGAPTTGMDGIPLADAFKAPSAKDIEAATTLQLQLAPLRDALKSRALQSQ